MKHDRIELNRSDRYFEELRTVVDSDEGDGILFFCHLVAKMAFIARQNGAPLSRERIELESPFFAMFLDCYVQKHSKTIKAMSASLEDGKPFASKLAEAEAFLRGRMATSSTCSSELG